MAKLPGKMASVKRARPSGPKLPTAGVNQPAIKLPKPKKPLGPLPSSGMPAQMGAPPIGGAGAMAPSPGPGPAGPTPM